MEQVGHVNEEVISQVFWNKEKLPYHQFFGHLFHPLELS